ncbi:MAG: FHA domain-containing protein [bacterium]
MLHLILSISKYFFLFFFFLFIYRIVKAVKSDLTRTSELSGQDLLCADVPTAILQDLKQGKKYNLSVPLTTLGRSAHNDIVLEDKYASYEHARIIVRNQHFYLEDLQSTNGTTVNGIILQGTIELQDGDQIEIGDLIFVFRR